MSSSAGQPNPAKRLAAIAGMLGSDHEGERANAARLATLELRRLGMTWHDLVQRAFSASQEQERAGPFRQAWQEGWEPARPPEPRRPSGSARPRTQSHAGFEFWDLVRYAHQHRAGLSRWEAMLVTNLFNLGPAMGASDSEWRILLQIAAKLGLEAAA